MADIITTYVIPGLGWLFSSVIGSLITYHFTRKRDNEKDRNELIGICHSICFYLALQISELTNLQINIKSRMRELEKIINNPRAEIRREKYMEILQDFPCHENVNININESSKIILAVGSDQRGILQALQDVFICDKNYSKVMSTLNRYSQAKHSLSTEIKGDDKKFISELFQFASNNFPEYEREINGMFQFARQTLDSFKQTMLDKLKIKINLGLGEVKRIN